MCSASFFKIKLNIFLDTLIQKMYFLIMKIFFFWGQLTDISSKLEALVLWWCGGGHQDRARRIFEG